LSSNEQLCADTRRLINCAVSVAVLMEYIVRRAVFGTVRNAAFLLPLDLQTRIAVN